ncbi:hypothetical protein FIBSPDRAFT_810481 [Athelia psychrophila]|uniref:Uncharacterized protein n=1 Tax=Athelia psychrophila TaxID=1759441 RepID=A0A166WP98_9AGAM|nr:hypothetical protein FIBSPDRAFT_810481 [Fibularhizoctonia sp. CBS 109695]
MFLAGLLLGILVAFPLHGFAQNVTVLTDDPRMHFDGTWVVQGSGEWEFTATVGSFVSMSFPGTAIYYHAAYNPRCGLVQVSIDGDSGVTIDASAGLTSQNATPIPAILFSQTGLEPGQNHTINITFLGVGSLGGSYLEMWNLTYTEDTSTSGAGAEDGSTVIETTQTITTAITVPASVETVVSTAVSTITESIAHGSSTVIESTKAITMAITVTAIVETLISTVVSTVTESVSSTAAAGPASSHHPNTGAIAGGVVGGLALLALLSTLLLCWRRRRTPAPAATPYADTTSQRAASQIMPKETPLDTATAQDVALLPSVPSSPTSPATPVTIGRPIRPLPVPPVASTAPTQTSYPQTSHIFTSATDVTGALVTPSEGVSPSSPPPPYRQERSSYV